MAIYAYVGAAVVLLLCLAWWLRKSWRAGWICLVVLLGAALMLTPAYPDDGVTTLAPAIIVAGFQLLTEGVEAAGHALRPLGTAVGVAVAVSLLLSLTLFRRRIPAAASPAAEREEEQ
jgi:hypothetical protein